MRLALVIAALLILLAGAASAATVTLTNGDQVSGELMRTEGRQLVIQNELIGVVRVPLAAVKDIETDQAYTVVIGTGDRVTGLLKTDGAGNLSIRSETGVVTTPLAEVNGMTPAPMELAFPDGVDQAIDVVVETTWAGEAELGVNWQTGNTKRFGLVAGFQVSRETDAGKTAIRGGAYYTEDDGERTANQQFLALQHDVTLTQHWYFFGLAALSRDEFKDIDLRGSLTPGIGYIFGDNEEWKLRAEAGPTLTWTDWTEADSEWTFELFFAVKGEIRIFDNARLSENIYWYPSVTNYPDGRIVSETAFEQPLSEKLFLKIAFVVNHDTTVEAPTKETDTALLVTLAIKF